MDRSRIVMATGIACLLATTLIGCWDAQSLEDQLIVLGIAVDVDPFDSSLLLLTMGAPTVEEEAETPFITFQGTGASINAAMRLVDDKSYRRILLGQVLVYLWGEELARQGVLPVLDRPRRNITAGGEMIIAVCNGLAADFLNARFPQQPLTAKYYSDALEQGVVRGLYPSNNLWHFLRDYLEPGISPSAPYIHFEGDAVWANQAAVFKGDEMVGVLTREESKMLNIIRGSGIDGQIIVTDPVTGFEIAALVTSAKIHVEVKRHEQGVAVDILIKLKGDLEEFAPASLDEKEDVVRLEAVLADGLTTWSRQLIDRLQQEFKTDAAGLGLHVRAKERAFFNSLEEWDDYFVDMEVTINSTFTLRHIGVVR